MFSAVLSHKEVRNHDDICRFFTDKIRHRVCFSRCPLSTIPKNRFKRRGSHLRKGRFEWRWSLLKGGSQLWLVHRGEWYRKLHFLSHLEVRGSVGLFTGEEVQIAIDKREENRLARDLIGDSNDLPLLRVAKLPRDSFLLSYFSSIPILCQLIL